MWNLIIFMAIQVILAETVAVTALFILFSRNMNSKLRTANHIGDIVVGLYFVPIFVYLMIDTSIPLTATGGWRSPSDVIAVSFYLLGVVPLVGIALLELGVIAKRRTGEGK